MRLGWHVAVAECEDAYVNIGVSYIFQTLVHGPLVSRDIILHRDDLVAAFPKSVENDASILFQVFVSGGKIDRRHGSVQAQKVISFKGAGAGLRVCSSYTPAAKKK